MSWLQTDDALRMMQTLGMLILLLIFLGVTWWLVLRKRSEVKNWSQLPFEDESPSRKKDLTH